MDYGKEANEKRGGGLVSENIVKGESEGAVRGKR